MNTNTAGTAAHSGPNHATAGIDQLVLGSEVFITRSRERVTIVGVIRWLDKPSQAYLRYVNGAGCACEDVFSFEEIEPAG